MKFGIMLKNRHYFLHFWGLSQFQKNHVLNKSKYVGLKYLFFLCVKHDMVIRQRNCFMEWDALRYFKKPRKESASRLADHIWYPLRAKWKFFFAATVAASEASPDLYGGFTDYLKHPVNNHYSYSEVSGRNSKA